MTLITEIIGYCDYFALVPNESSWIASLHLITLITVLQLFSPHPVVVIISYFYWNIIVIRVTVGCTETANKVGTWLREISSCCCLTTASKTRQLLLNKIHIPFLPSLNLCKRMSHNLNLDCNIPRIRSNLTRVRQMHRCPRHHQPIIAGGAPLNAVMSS